MVQSCGTGGEKWKYGTVVEQLVSPANRSFYSFWSADVQFYI